MVVAVALRVRATGGYSVEINHIRHYTTDRRQCTVEIRYVETVTSGVSIDAPTYPYHAVKCQRVGYRYVFIKEPDG
jgi:hypothetical protein